MRARGPTVFLVLALAVGLLAVFLVRHELGAVVFALALGYMLRPFYLWVRRGVKKRMLAAGIVLLAVAVVLLAPFVFLAMRFMEEALAVARSIESREDLRTRISDMLGSLGLPDAQVERFSARIVEEGAQYLQQQLVPIVTMAAEFLLSLVVFFILLYYVLVDGHRLVAWLERVLPAPRDEVHGMLERAGDRVKAITLGTFVVSLVQGVLAGLGWWILGLPAPVFWGAVMLVLSVIPVVGAFIVLLPAAAWSFAQGDIVAGVGLLVLNFVMVGVIDDALRPYMIGKRAGVHPSLILLGIVGGIPFFGISGILLGPLLMGLLAPLFEAWAEPGGRRMPPAGALETERGSHNST